MAKMSCLLSALILLVMSAALSSALWLPQSISSNMVLQRAPQSARLWGSANANALITITLDSTSAHVFADGNGEWQYELPPQQSSVDRRLVIDGDGQQVELSNIAFGDVYVCSGQSNMDYAVIDAFTGSDTIADSIHYPHIRLFSISRSASLTPLNDTINRWNDTAWAVSAPKYVGGASFQWFSAVCYFFGRDIYKSLNGTVPIGLIMTAYGGTIAEAWTTPKGLQVCGPVSTAATNRQLFARDQVGDVDPNTPSVLFNAMIYPIIKARLAGVLWYQGESNVYNASNYACRFPAMINDWREQFNDYRLPFYFVLLAAFDGGGFPDWPNIRQAQLAGLSVPYTAVASAQDLGDRASPNGGIHPRNKTVVGTRLALIARNQIYGATDVVYSGPSLSDIIWPIDRSPIQTAILRFRSADRSSAGLHLLDTSFCVACCNISGSPVQLAMSDGNLYRAVVSVMSDDFLVIATVNLSQTINEYRTTAVTINWEPFSECAIYNSHNLPHLPMNIAKTYK